MFSIVILILLGYTYQVICLRKGDGVVENKINAEYIATLTHDLRAPLGVINGYAKALLDGTVPKEAAEKYIGIIEKESARLAALVEEQFQLSRLECEPDVKTVFNLAEEGRLALIAYSEVFERKGIQPCFDCEELAVKANLGRVRRMLACLAENSAKYTPHGGRVCLAIKKEGARARISLYNSGAAIPRDRLPRLFERFYRDPDTASGVDGTGLGLYIVKSVSDKEGAEIRAISEDKGVTFTFSLPLAK